MFEKGDWRSGYYRDQTLMFALGALSVREYFAQLYAHADLAHEPASGGRMMNAHFVTRNVNPDGSWRDLTAQYNTAADASPTAAQMPRLTGLAYASKLFRDVEALHDFATLSHHGDEVAFGVIGNASTAEGHFWETVNAIGVLGAPAVISIWDDGYGISVPNEHQMLKQNLTELLAGFQRDDDGEGFDIYRVAAWDYEALVSAYELAASNARRDHIPAIIHVIEATQPQGHSTSGSHERYKPQERLDWEAERDCVAVMREWILDEELITLAALETLEAEAKAYARAEQKAAWRAFVESIRAEQVVAKSFD